MEDFREALVSFGLGGDNATADRLFNLYDWRQSKRVNFQVFVMPACRWCFDIVVVPAPHRLHKAGLYTWPYERTAVLVLR